MNHYVPNSARTEGPALRRRRIRGRSRRVALAGLAAAATFLSACALDTTSLGTRDAPTSNPKEKGTTQTAPAPDAGDMPAAPAGLEEFYTQDVDWDSCRGGAECASVTVPLDYANPDNGKTIELELKRYPATGEKIGTLFLNPGGPGGSGIEYADSFVSGAPQQIRERFDILGFDPRGVGSSTPIDCMSDAELDEAIESWSNPLTDEGIAASEETAKEIAGKCQEKAGDMLPYIGTASAARDIDVMRQLVGDPKLYYFGASYGTALGAQYADLFPQNTGRLVLDGAVDVTVDRSDADYQQMLGFETAARKYAEQCDGPECPLTGSVDDKLHQIQDLLDSLEDNPLPTSDPDRPLGTSLGLHGVILPLYISQYDYLSMALDQAINDGDGSLLLYLADIYLDRDERGRYADNSMEALWAVNCADYLPYGADKARANAEKLEENSLAFGAVAGGTDICEAWPYHPEKNPGPFAAKGSAPILVIGTENDPATPYEWAVNLEGDFENARLLTWKGGEGHTAFMRGSSCIDDTVTRYLVDGEVPDENSVCK